LLIPVSAPTVRLNRTATENWTAVVGAFLIEKAGRTGSRRTPDEYRRILRRFLAGRDPALIRAIDVHAFAYGPGPAGTLPSASTTSVRLAAIGGLFDFGVRMGLLSENVAARVRRPKLRPPAPRGLDAGGVRRLLESIPDTAAGRRDRAIVSTMIFVGLRRSEVLSIRLGDLRLLEPMAVAVRVKGGIHRRIALPPPVAEAIRTTLVDVAVAGRSPAFDMRVFPTSATAFGVNLRRYARAAGLGDVSPHALRHTAAKLRRDAGASIEDVGRLLGHRTIATTARYLARLEGTEDRTWPAVAALLGAVHPLLDDAQPR
jgi:integrase